MSNLYRVVGPFGTVIHVTSYVIVEMFDSERTRQGVSKVDVRLEGDQVYIDKIISCEDSGHPTCLWVNNLEIHFHIPKDKLELVYGV